MISLMARLNYNRSGTIVHRTLTHWKGFALITLIFGKNRPIQVRRIYWFPFFPFFFCFSIFLIDSNSLMSRVLTHLTLTDDSLLAKHSRCASIFQSVGIVNKSKDSTNRRRYTFLQVTTIHTVYLNGFFFNFFSFMIEFHKRKRIMNLPAQIKLRISCIQY